MRDRDDVRVRPGKHIARRRLHRFDPKVPIRTARVNGQRIKKRLASCVCGWRGEVWRPLADAVQEWTEHYEGAET